MRPTNMFHRNGLMAAAGLVLLVGCNSAEPVGTLQGKVTLDGAPVSDARVQIEERSTGRAAAADVNAGSYRFETPITVGEYHVSILPKFEAPVAGEGDENVTPPERPDIPEKYRNPGTSGVTVTVSEGDNTLDVEMKAE